MTRLVDLLHDASLVLLVVAWGGCLVFSAIEAIRWHRRQ